MSVENASIECSRAMKHPADVVFATILDVSSWTSWAQVNSASATDAANEPTGVLVGGGRLSSVLTDGTAVVETVNVDSGAKRLVLATSSGAFKAPGTGTVTVEDTGNGTCVVYWAVSLGKPPGGWVGKRRTVASIMISRGTARSLKKLDKVVKKRAKESAKSR